jgi:hypothetical protein
VAKPRRLEELEIEVFDWGTELKHCMTGIGCESCPETGNQKCPASKVRNSKGPQSEQPSEHKSPLLELHLALEMLCSSVFQSNLMTIQI